MKAKKYYAADLKKLYNFLIPQKAKTIFFNSGDKVHSRGNFDYIILNNIIGDLEDVQEFTGKLKRLADPDTRLIVTYYNHLWEPILKFASYMGWRKNVPDQNWLDMGDINNILNIEGFEVISTHKRFLFPLYIPVLSDFINKWIAPLPLINNLCLSTYLVARSKPVKETKYSVSIIIPAKNEAGNIRKITDSIPRFGKKQEIIFVEGHSNDDTWEMIKKEIGRKHKAGVTVKAFKQIGQGKADAVHLGFEKANGEILMIYDSDRTVDPKDLEKFYDVLSTGVGEFANGSRLVYPMEKEAMRTLNKIGNVFFGSIFTWVLKQRFKDTLCGTKALFRKDYIKIVDNKEYFGNFDPFGDFDLIFGAVKQNIKVVEVPVRYKERVYGKTNIDRFRNFLELVRMVWLAYRKFNTF